MPTTSIFDDKRYTARATPREHPGGGPYQLCELRVYDIKEYAEMGDNAQPEAIVDLGDPMSVAQELVRLDLIVNQKLDPNSKKFRERFTAIRKALGFSYPERF